MGWWPPACVDEAPRGPGPGCRQLAQHGGDRGQAQHAVGLAPTDDAGRVAGDGAGQAGVGGVAVPHGESDV